MNDYLFHHSELMVRINHKPMEHTERLLMYMLKQSHEKTIHWPVLGSHILITNGMIYCKNIEEVKYILKCGVSLNFIDEFVIKMYDEEEPQFKLSYY